LFIINDSKQVGDFKSSECDDGIDFTDEKTQEFHELIETQISSAQKGKNATIITMDNGEDINVDDI
jgi:hypothetical protein